MTRSVAVVLALLLVVPLSGCSPRRSDDVVVSFYPLEYVAQRIVGSRLPVVNLARPGVEPHDLELRPTQIAKIASARVVLHEEGLQPAVDEAIEQNRPEHVVDATDVVRLHRSPDGVDPHFWLDPTLLARAADGFTREMVRADPTHAAEYRRNLARLRADLTALDEEITSGLRACRTRDVVVSHDAFGYFGRRYDLDVHAVAGLSPDAEPSARRLAELADLARDQGVTTVFSETLVSPKLAETLADEAGLRTAVLDPIEGLTSKDPRADYLSLMRENLRALRVAGGCS